MFCVMRRSENTENGRYCWKCGAVLVNSSHGLSSFNSIRPLLVEAACPMTEWQPMG
jgi:hypothetical protein